MPTTTCPPLDMYNTSAEATPLAEESEAERPPLP